METRRQIIDAAEDAIRRRGYEGFSYADLSRVVGIRKASIHHHFSTKADLALAVVEAYAEAFLGRLKALSEQGLSAGESLAEYVSLYRQALGEGGQLCLCVALSAGPDSLSERVLLELSKFHAASEDWLRGMFETAQRDGSVTGVKTPSQEAAATLALMEGAQLRARAAKDADTFDFAVSAFLQRLNGED